MKKLKFIMQEIKTLFELFWAGITSPFTMVLVVTLGGGVGAAQIPRNIKDEYITPLMIILTMFSIICIIGICEKVTKIDKKDKNN